MARGPEAFGRWELIDQGVHLIDLAGWFLGAFTRVAGHADTLYWDMPVDDNASWICGPRMGKPLGCR